MRKFLKTALAFVAIGLALNAVLATFRPPYYGNECHRAKDHYFFNMPHKPYNTVAFGSSQLHNHIYAPLLDSLLSPLGISAFNFASEGTINPEHLYLYKHFLEKMPPNTIKYAFVELKDVALPVAEPITNARYDYWIGVKDLAFIADYVRHDPEIIKKPYLFGSYLLGYGAKHLEYTKEHYLFPRSTEDDSTHVRAVYQGFKPLRLTIEGVNPNYVKVHQRFLADTGIIQRDQALVKDQLRKNKPEDCLNPVLLKKFEEVLALSAQKGVHVMFVISAQHSQSNACGLYAIRDRLPANHVIDLSNMEKYPLLYQTKYHFDDSHLNDTGAKLFTQYLAEEVKRCLGGSESK